MWVVGNVIIGWTGGGGGGGGGTVDSAENGLYLFGTAVRMGTNPLIENTDIKMDTFNWRVSSGVVPVLFTEPNTNYVGIRTESPQYGTHAIGNDLASGTIATGMYSDNTLIAPAFRTLYARGTEGAPVDTPNNAVIGQNYFSAYDGSNFIDTIRMRVVANEDIDGTGESARMIYSFKLPGGTSFTDRIIFNQSSILIQTSGLGNTSATKSLQIDSSTVTDVFFVRDDQMVSASLGYSITGVRTYYENTPLTSGANIWIGAANSFALTTAAARNIFIGFMGDSGFTDDGSNIYNTMLGYAGGGRSILSTGIQYNTWVGSAILETAGTGSTVGRFQHTTLHGQGIKYRGTLNATIIGVIGIGSNLDFYDSHSMVVGSSDETSWIDAIYLGQGQYLNTASFAIKTLKIQPTNPLAGADISADFNFVIAGRQGTGTGIGSTIIMQVAPAGSTGSTHNTLVTAITFSPATAYVIFAAGTTGIATAQMTVGNLLSSPIAGGWEYSANRIYFSPNSTPTRHQVKTKHNVTITSGSPYTATVDTELVNINASGVFTVNLPAAPLDNDEITICDGFGDAGSNTKTIGRNGENIDGAAADSSLTVNFQSKTFRYIATYGWKTIY